MPLVEADKRFMPNREADGRLEPSISVVGLDAAGVERIADYAGRGFRVIGVDVSMAAVRAIKDGKSPTGSAKGVAERIADGVRRGQVDATQNIIAAVIDTDVTVLPVGDIAFAQQATRAIGQALSIKDGFHVILLCGSADAGGVIEMVVRTCEIASGKRLGVGFGLCVSPESWREELVTSGRAMPALLRATDAKAAQWVSPLYEAAA